MSRADHFDEPIARHYDSDEAAMFAPEVLEPTVALLAGLADGGPVLEFAIGTGRVALPLAQRGLAVSGIDWSGAMLQRLREKPGAEAIEAVVGDMATTRLPGEFSLVFLVFNTLGNLLHQAEQVACFRNAAAHLRPGGHFVVEMLVPGLRRLPPGSGAVVSELAPGHSCIDRYDPLTQRLESHHYTRRPDGSFRYGMTPQRWVWPAEMDLMGELAGLVRVARWADWNRAPFTADSASHISVWKKPETAA